MAVTVDLSLQFFGRRLLAILLSLGHLLAWTAEMPDEWVQWLKASKEIEGSLTADDVARRPEARTMDAWLATRNHFQLRAFESKLRDQLFFSRSQDSYNIEISAQRSQVARALFCLTSSLRLEELARRFLFGSPLRRRINPYSGTRFMVHPFFSYFYAHQHWRRANFWPGAIAQLIFMPAAELKGISEVSPNHGPGFDARVARWKVSFLRSEWNTAPVDSMVSTLEELVESVPDEGMENYLVEKVLSRKDLIARPEWKYWVWSLLEPLFPYTESSPLVLERAKKILRLLQLPGTEAHVVLIERLLKRKDRSLDSFIEKELLSNPPLLGHPLLVQIGRGPSPSVSRLRYAFAIGDSINLWSPSIGRTCQAYLRRGYLKAARRIGIHPVQLIKTFGVRN
jgi:hypothetical protein